MVGIVMYLSPTSVSTKKQMNYILFNDDAVFKQYVKNGKQIRPDSQFVDVFYADNVPGKTFDLLDLLKNDKTEEVRMALPNSVKGTMIDVTLERHLRELGLKHKIDFYDNDSLVMKQGI